MKAHSLVSVTMLSVQLASLIAAPDAPKAQPHPSTHRVTLKEAVAITSKQKPAERLVLLFTRFSGDKAHYRWLYFNPLSSDWVTGVGKVQEVYDKVKASENGAVVVAVPGHNTQIQAGEISLSWSRGDKRGSWLYAAPDRYEVRSIPAADFDRIE